MKAWFERFSLREQGALLFMSAAVFLYVLLMFVLLPLSQARTEWSARNLATAEVLRRVDVMAAEILSLRDSSEELARTSSGNLSASLNQSASRYSLRVSRLQPNSQGSVQLRFESAPLPSLLRWIHELETVQGLRIDELSFGQTSAAGIVSASLRVASAK